MPEELTASAAIPKVEPVITPASVTLETGLTRDEVTKMIQSETDKVRTEYVRKLKDKQGELEELEKAKLNEEEKRKFDLDKKERELAEQESELRHEKIKSFATDELSKAELPIEFREFVLDSDQEKTKIRIDIMKTKYIEAVDNAVKKAMQGIGHEPTAGETPPPVNDKDKLISQYNEAEKIGDVLTMQIAQGKINSLA